MRVIKYRAWVPDFKQMVEVYAINFINDFIEHSGFDWDCVRNKKIPLKTITSLINCKLLQYTGMKDKSDEEIYEGDILDIFCYVESFKKKRKSDKCILQLKYCDGVYNLFSLDGSIPYTCVSLVYGINPKQTEVINNIYENPESIEVAR